MAAGVVGEQQVQAEPFCRRPSSRPGAHGLICLPDTAFGDAFAPNAAAEELAVLTAVQRPISPSLITVAVPRPLWKDCPTWFLVAEQDRMIVEDNQRFMAERMRARVVSPAVDHTPIVTAPDVVSEVLGEAIAAVRADSVS